ncbi:hypothetical protein P1P75_01245 [Streptomyces sp. ID05-39B]|uniref:hypothetical protein n=1 Tax=Streptomyces sp. ID05-39B TaxID=3028664 RepID=UPI0029A79743|nr:hypothetical protein [Streptomyces sp. ID05-39B]MDX3525107.1 hypothetical protein [Streptomyces sp. ID05-39B]
MERARRTLGGYGTGEGYVGLADDGGEAPHGCGLCSKPAVLYFVETAEETQHYTCLDHAGAVAYDVAVASTAGPNIPASERGADDRRWRKNE